MRLLFLADAHLGAYKTFDQNGSRLDRCLEAMKQVFAAATKHQCIAIIDCGDLIDAKNHIDFAVYNRIYEMFAYRTSRRPYHTLVGNHNLANRIGDTNLMPLSNHLTEIATASVMQFEDIIVGFIPYQRNLDDWHTAYASVCEQVTPMAGIKVLVAHQEIQGAVTGTHRYVAKGGLEPITESPFTYAIFGHYHRCQTVGNTMYCGALLQQGFGEEGNIQGFWIFDTEAEQPWTQHTIETPAFVTVSLEEYQANKETLKGNFVRIRSETDVAQDLKETPNVQVEVIPPIQHAPRLHVAASDDIDGLMQAYIQQRVPAEIQNDVQVLAAQIMGR